MARMLRQLRSRSKVSTFTKITLFWFRSYIKRQLHKSMFRNTVIILMQSNCCARYTLRRLLLNLDWPPTSTVIFPTLSGNCVLQEWQDERLTWNPVDFGNLTDIIVRADKLWLPELAVMNGFVVAVFFHFDIFLPTCSKHKK